MADARRDKFVWDMSAGDVVLSQCFYCKRLSERPVTACAAFPGGIPAEILANQFDHREPWIDPETGEPGDTGISGERSILFEPRDEINPLALAALYGYLEPHAE